MIVVLPSFSFFMLLYIDYSALVVVDAFLLHMFYGTPTCINGL